MSGKRHSPSSVAAYGTCPRRYYWRHIVRVPRRPNAAQQLGINVHAALELFERQGGLRTGGLDQVLRCLEATWGSEGFEDAAQEEAARREAESQLAAQLAFPHQDELGTPVLLEARLEGELEGLKVVGIVDRVDRRADGSLALIDYKTGGWSTQGPHVDHVQQLALYRELVRQSLGSLPQHVSLVFPGQGVQQVELPDAAWETVLQDALRTMRAIEADETFEARVSTSCPHCEFSRRCVPWRRACLGPLSEGLAGAGQGVE